MQLALWQWSLLSAFATHTDLTGVGHGFHAGTADWREQQIRRNSPVAQIIQRDGKKPVATLGYFLQYSIHIFSRQLMLEAQ
jgi:hypothetical protein